MRRQKLNKIRKLLFIGLLICPLNIWGISYTDTDFVSNLSDVLTSQNEGLTTFRSLLIPLGGRAESMGNAFTGLCNDIGFFNYNAAGSAIQTQTQLGATHNSWIADSNLESISFTTRFGDFGTGFQVQTFYLPFAEYNIFGDKTNNSYYTETIGLLNFAYNFFPGYDFKGLAVGVNLKAAWRGMPDYTDNDTDAIIQNSGLQQSALGLMADTGILMQFNFLKFYSSREPNLRIGLSAQNLGVSLTGFGSNQGIILDDPPPTQFAAGISWQIIKPITISLDFKQPLFLSDAGQYILFSTGAGISIQFTEFLGISGGLELKGGNPRISLGLEAEVYRLAVNVNYTLDMTSSTSPVNRISLCAKIFIGDKGRADRQGRIDELYSLGLEYYSNGNWEKAVETWNKILKIDRHYDPAILGIKSAQSQIDMLEKIRESMILK